jgi:hypothetical protein
MSFLIIENKEVILSKIVLIWESMKYIRNINVTLKAVTYKLNSFLILSIRKYSIIILILISDIQMM